MPDLRRTPLLVALMLGLLLSELDQSMVAAGLPRIVADVDGISDLMWVNTGYLLAATAILPLSGALGDRWGRRSVIVVGLLLIMVGSSLGGLATTMPALIIARVVQGLGAGGMLVLTQAAVADVWPVRERAPVMSVIGAVFAAAAVGGPLLGGWLTAGPGWRWMFWINLPVGAAALVACLALLPGADRTGPRRPTRAADLLPLGLLRNRTFGCVAAAGFGLGLATFGVFGYLPTYLQLGRGLDPVEAGLWMLPLVAGLAIGTLASAQLVSRTGIHRPLPVLGALLAAAGLAGLALLGATGALPAVGAGFGLLGLGVGLSWEVLVVMLQNSVAEERVGAATALNGFSREIGVLLGSALVGGMLSSGLAAGADAVEVITPVFSWLAGAAALAAGVLLLVHRRPLSTQPPAVGRAATTAGRR